MLYIPLQWWGMTVGVESLITLPALGLMREVTQHDRPALGVLVYGE